MPHSVVNMTGSALLHFRSRYYRARALNFLSATPEKLPNSPLFLSAREAVSLQLSAASPALSD
jgi:hypothetical protein